MKVLIYGAGVIGTVYGWQLSKSGHDVTLLVRKGKKAVFQDGVFIRCIDQRVKGAAVPVETCFHAAVVEELSPENDYDWIIVAVKSNQLDEVLPALAENSGSANILFFQNNWWGDQKIKTHLQPDQYLFGFSRLVGGWKNGNMIECILFNAPGMGTMLGEKDGKITPRLQQMVELLKSANLSPEISLDILGWLQFHYVEYLGATGASLEDGSTQAFVKDRELVRKAILATREGLAICRARGADVKAAPSNLKFFNLPLFLLVPLAQYQYRMPNIQKFFEENISQGLEELIAQYRDVTGEGKRLGLEMPVLAGFEPYFRLNHMSQ